MTPQKVKQHTSTKFEKSSSLALRWVFRYKLFFFIGFLIFGMQVFLMFKSSGLFQSTSNRTYNLAASKSSATNNRVFPVDAFDDEDLHSNSNVFAKTNEVSVNEKRLNRSAQYLKDLTFVPSCDFGTNKEAVSAIHRAKTMECKRQIVDTVCNVQRGTFYPRSLPNSCPSGNFTANRPLGCYKDEKNFRVLSSYFVNFKVSNTPQKCIQLCLQSGFQYAGLQYS
jgi:protein xylosyltransferase